MTGNKIDSLLRVVDYGVATRPFPGELECGDLHAVIPRRRGAIVAVVDGLGHGYEAALAVCVQPVSATPLAVYRLAFGSPRSFADVD